MVEQVALGGLPVARSHAGDQGVEVRDRSQSLPSASDDEIGGDASHLFDSGDHDQRLVLNAYGISPLTPQGVGGVGIDEKLDDGPVMPRNL